MTESRHAQDEEASAATRSSCWGIPDDLTKPDVRLGALVLELLETQRDWIWRRVESVKFLDAVVYQRQHTVTAKAPPVLDMDATPGTILSTRPPYVPIVLLQKSLLTRFKVVDGSGHSLATLGRPKANWLAWSVLVAAAKAALYEAGTKAELDQRIEQELGTIANKGAAEAQIARKKLPDAADKSQETAQQLTILEASAPFQKLLLDLTFNWILFVSIENGQPDAAGSEGQVFTLSYIKCVRWGRTAARHDAEHSDVYLPPHTLGLDGRRRSLWARIRDRQFWLFLKWRFFLRHAWLQPDAAFPTPSFPDCQSYHFEAEAPPGFYVTRTSLTYQPVDGPPGRAKWRRGMAGGHSGHVYARSAPHARRATVRVVFTPIARGLLRHAAVFGSVAAAVMILALVFLRKVIESDTQTTAAFLLILPTIAVAFLVRPNDHEMASAMYTGVKGMVLAACLPLHVGALFTLAISNQWVLYWSWIGLTTVACTCAWLLLKSYYTPVRFLLESVGEARRSSSARAAQEEGAVVDDASVAVEGEAEEGDTADDGKAAEADSGALVVFTKSHRNQDFCFLAPSAEGPRAGFQDAYAAKNAVQRMHDFVKAAKAAARNPSPPEPQVPLRHETDDSNNTTDAGGPPPAEISEKPQRSRAAGPFPLLLLPAFLALVVGVPAFLGHFDVQAGRRGQEFTTLLRAVELAQAEFHHIDIDGDGLLEYASNTEELTRFRPTLGPRIARVQDRGYTLNITAGSPDTWLAVLEWTRPGRTTFWIDEKGELRSRKGVR